MKRKNLLTYILLFVAFCTSAKTVDVKNIEELNQANATAQPGDIFILQNGEWKNVTISLNCKGTKELPITFKVQTEGKVMITGKSRLELGGTYIMVDGLYFTNGYGGVDVIKFRIDKNQVATNCRVTNTVINDFNNPKRIKENYWVTFYGKNNRLDHCSFFNKKNLGVLLAVRLEDDLDRENFHSIDHNYFGFRMPLASNAGEIIRIGVAENCQYNSNTQVVDNFFEHCDGEAEVISIKSGQNVVRNNLFKECQGSVVLRHGNYNTIESNIFLGNSKEGTGGVRIINKGNWIVNNLFYYCRGTGFRSPLTLMNGVPNSPPVRYVEVTDAVVANNTFLNCTPFSLCEGRDSERTVPPRKVEFVNNMFYNNLDTTLYYKFDNIDGINFGGNLVSKSVKQVLAGGFIEDNLASQKVGFRILPESGSFLGRFMSDSFQIAAKARLLRPFISKPGFTDAKLWLEIENNAYKACGANWFNYAKSVEKPKIVTVNCASSDELLKAIANLNSSKPSVGAVLHITLTGSVYSFTSSLPIASDVSITSTPNRILKFSLQKLNAPFLFHVLGGKKLSIHDVTIDFEGAEPKIFVSTDTSGSSSHSNFSFANSSIQNFNGTFLRASKYSIADSMIISRSNFTQTNGVLFDLYEETDKMGYYNVEKFKLTNCNITSQKGQVLRILRSGKDESTMGPNVIISQNTLTNCTTDNGDGLIRFFGVQRTLVEKNTFTDCNAGKTLLQYEDIVRASHRVRNNTINNSGKIAANKFVKIETR